MPNFGTFLLFLLFTYRYSGQKCSIAILLLVIIRISNLFVLALAENRINMKTAKSYNVQIWVGLRIGYTDTVHSLDDVRNICDKWCNEIRQCVTITPTEYRYVDGNEKGVVVGFINYPRFPSSEDMLINRAVGLAKALMIGLGQNRVSVVTPEKTYMLENE